MNRNLRLLRVFGWLSILALYAPVCLAQTSDPPSIITQPLSSTNQFGTDPKFTVVAAGTVPLKFQWFKDTQALEDGTLFSGARSSVLNIAAVRKAYEGPYRVVITNSFGSVTSSVATLTVLDPAIRFHPLHRNVGPGVYADFTGAAVGTPPLEYQWLLNGNVLPGPTNTSCNVFSSATNAGIVSFVARNMFGSVTSTPAVLTVNTTTVDDFSADASGSVYATAIQGDGKVIVGGDFTTLWGGTRNRIGRLLPDGHADLEFNPGANGTVNCILPQSDGKLIIGGAFTSLAGKTCNYLGRLHADGRLDTSFHVTVNGPVYCLAQQQWDGRILAGGLNTLKRFDESGVVDLFFPGPVSGTIYSIVTRKGDPTAGNLVFLGGSFSISSAGGYFRSNLAQLNEDGTPDANFNIPVTGQIYAMALQSDSHLLLGGSFTKVDNQSRTNLARLHILDGLDASFNPGASGPVYTMAVQADGKVVVGGGFYTLAGVSRAALGRLNLDGSIDPLFNPGASAVHGLALQADGKLIVGGNFTALGGTARKSLGRLNATGDAAQTLGSHGPTIRWLRGGALPEVEDVVFELYLPGNGWIHLGNGVRISGGWETSVTVDPDATFRARGKAVGGRGCGSGSIIEFAAGPIVISSQPASPLSVATLATLNVGAIGGGPMTYQWYRNGVAIANATNSYYSAIFGSYQVVLCNPLGCIQSKVANVWRLDPLESNPNSNVWALAVQADGKILIGGAFTSIANTPRRGLARLNPDGTLDNAFNPDVMGTVICLAVLPDSRIVLGGGFTNVGGLTRRGLARLNSDGSLDTGFVTKVWGEYDSTVHCLAPQSGGKLLVGGNFYAIGGESRTDLARLEADGSVDNGFVPRPNLDSMGTVSAIVPLANGLILLGGRLQDSPGFYQSYEWVQQNGDYAGHGYQSRMPVGGSVLAILEQPDGKVILGGYEFQVDTLIRRTLARLNADGSPDTSFTASVNGTVICLAAQADGKVLVGGAFTMLNGVARNGLGRLNSNGSLDANFDPNVNRSVSAIALQPDGRVLFGGTFNTVGTTTRSNFTRLAVSEDLPESWTYDGSSLTWLRGGPSPELEDLVLETSADGLAWEPFAEGARIDGGWSIAGVSLPFSGQVRARGAMVGSGVDTSQAGVPLTGPVITAQPISRTNLFGTHVGFYVVVQGPPPLGYQWYRNGVALNDGIGIVGAHASLLALQVDEADEGSYLVVVTNLFGSATSGEATLTTMDPATPPSVLSGEPGFGFNSQNRFSFQIGALPGQTCIVERSDNMTSWSPMSTNAVYSSGLVTFTDPAATPAPRCFYRVRLK